MKPKPVSKQTKEQIAAAVPGANTLDKDYVFINFVMTYLPPIVDRFAIGCGILAAMSSMAEELNSHEHHNGGYKRSIK